jgi:formylglycine-generating enzyme required for sulfatase activity
MKQKLWVTLAILVVGAVAAAVVAAKQNPITYVIKDATVVPLEPEMAELAGGVFRMGNPDGMPHELPVHEVELSPFAIGKYEVTNAEYARFVQATGRPDPPDPWFWKGQNTFRSKPDYPVVEISWSDAAAYCKWLADKTGKPYHLPTEAQWEFAARGGLEGAAFPWGDEKLPNMARMMTREQEGPGPVGQYPPNGYGLYDVAGNVNEMVADWFDETYYASSPRVDPTGPSGMAAYLGLLDAVGRSRKKGRCHVVKGGSYRAPFDWQTKNPDGRFETPVQCGAREYLYQAPYTHFDLGFRVARSRSGRS